jgi:uroporphyrin-III C-methyltransferase
MRAIERLRLPDFAPGSVWLVGAGPGDPGLLTVHALGALEQADVILHDALVDPAVLGLASSQARLEPVGKRAGRPSPKQIRINERLIEVARSGLRVVRLKGGDPFLFGRGGEEALALAAAGVPFRVVPGVSSGTAGAAAAGIPVTHRGIAQAVTFVTGHGAAGHPPATVDWAALARSSAVLVLFMARRRIERIAAELLAAGRAADEPVALISDATTPRQTTIVSTLVDVTTAARALPEDRPTLIVIGSTVALHHLLAGHQEIGPSIVAASRPDVGLATGS